MVKRYRKMTKKANGKVREIREGQEAYPWLWQGATKMPRFVRTF